MPNSSHPHDAGNSELSARTAAVHFGRPNVVADGPVNTPIVASSTLHAGGEFGYHREWNETYGALEDLIGNLEGGYARVFASGMGAANAVFDLFAIGDVVVAGKFSYTGVSVRLRELADAGRIVLRTIDVTENSELERAVIGADGEANATWVWLESPTNPMMEICDIKFAADISHSVGAKLVVDNTFMTPARQRPLELGADVVMHSVTKGLAGHSDLLMGALVTSDKAMAEEFLHRRVLLGAVSSAFDAFLAIRGIRTLFVRIDCAEQNAIELAERLSEHPKVTKVHYPGLPAHKNAAIAKDQSSGPGTMLSFEVAGDAQAADWVCQQVSVIGYATSLGGVETLMERRRRWPAEHPDIPENLIRLSVGIEDVRDIWADLKQALDQLN